MPFRNKREERRTGSRNYHKKHLTCMLETQRVLHGDRRTRNRALVGEDEAKLLKREGQLKDA